MRTLPLAAGIAALLLGGCATPYMRAKAAEKKADATLADALYGKGYVAIGASYSAGPMLPPPKPGAPLRCGQSLSNFPTLLAERFGMVLTDASCSGASTAAVLGAWNEIAPQIASVRADTRLVTVSIGGNDVQYVGNFFASACLEAQRRLPAGAAAKPCPSVHVPSEAEYARLEANLVEIGRQVRKRAPRARLVFLQYLTLLPDGPLCAATPIRPEDAAPFRATGARLAAITVRAAAAEGATVIQMNEASKGHSPCDKVPWLVGQGPGTDPAEGLAWHPNKQGMIASAEGVAWWLARRPGQVTVGPAEDEQPGKAGGKAEAPVVPILPETSAWPPAPPAPQPSPQTSPQTSTAPSPKPSASAGAPPSPAASSAPVYGPRDEH